MSAWMYVLAVVAYLLVAALVYAVERYLDSGTDGLVALFWPIMIPVVMVVLMAAAVTTAIDDAVGRLKARAPKQPGARPYRSPPL